MENPIKMEDLGGKPTILLNRSTFVRNFKDSTTVA